MTAPVAPPAPDLAGAIERGEAAQAQFRECSCSSDCDARPSCLTLMEEALAALLAASRAAMEERDQKDILLNTAGAMLRKAGHWRFADEIAEALAPAAKEENRG